MRLFYPTAMLPRISDIRADMLKMLGISALILDVDNTLVSHGGPVPDRDVVQWLKAMQNAGMKLAIASNNNEARVAAFAGRLSLDFIANAMKPLPIGFLRISKRLGLPASRFGVVGDQIFTDILGGNLFGAKTFLIQPLSDQEPFSIRLKRKIEAGVLESYKKR